VGGEHFRNTLEAILKVQLEGRDGSSDSLGTGKKFVAKKPPPMYFPPIPPGPGGRGRGFPPPGGVSALGGTSYSLPSNVDWTYFVALKLDSLVPLGQLLENIEGVQNSIISDLGQGVVCKTAEPCDLHLPLIFINENEVDALNVALATLTQLPILSRNVIEFGGILPGKGNAAVTMALFSESLDSLITHLVAHLERTNGLVVARPEKSGSIPQAGLFSLDILSILQPDNYKKPSQKARFGKYDWCKLHVVKVRTNSIAATIDVDVDESAL